MNTGMNQVRGLIVKQAEVHRNVTHVSHNAASIFIDAWIDGCVTLAKNLTPKKYDKQSTDPNAGWQLALPDAERLGVLLNKNLRELRTYLEGCLQDERDRFPFGVVVARQVIEDEYGNFMIVTPEAAYSAP